MQVYYYINEIIYNPAFEKKNKRKIKQILKNLGAEDGCNTLHTILYEARNLKTYNGKKLEYRIIDYLAVFARCKLTENSIFIFNSLLDLDHDVKRALRFAADLYNVKNISGVYFLDYSIKDLQEIKASLFSCLKMKDSTHAVIRWSIRDLIPKTGRLIEQFYVENEEIRLLGQDYEKIKRLDDMKKYVSMQKIADYIQFSSRSLNNKVENNCETKGMLQLTEEQKALIDEALNADYEVHCQHFIFTTTEEKL